MTDRVSDGLLAELQRKIDDGTPRGIVWPFKARLLILAADLAQTDEDVAMVNDALASILQLADEKAFAFIQMGALADQLRDLTE